MAATIDGTADFADDYTYDSLGRVVSVIEHGVTGGNAVAEKEITLAYNDAGQLLSIDRYENGQLAVEGDYSYDEQGRLVGLVYRQGETVLNSYAWTYSDASGVAFTSQGSTEWTPTGGLMPITDTTGVTDALLYGGFAGVSLLTSCTSNDGVANYSYDPTGQLTGAQYSGGVLPDEAYSYDANGNRVTANGSGYVTGADNRLLSDGTYAYAYDNEGNRIARFVDVNADGQLDAGDTRVTEYAWDNRNRLVEVTSRDTAGGSATQVVEYLYDVENRWVGENIDVNGDGQIDHATRFAYDGNQIVLQFDKDVSGGAPAGSSGSPLTVEDLSHRYLWQANAVDQLMADERTHLDGNSNVVTDEVLWALTDQQGTVHDLAKLNTATGVTSVVDHIVRDSFGNVTSESNPSQGSLIGFTGLPFDNGSAIYRTPTRPYDPLTGRWDQPDWIIQLGGQTNLYAYCGSSPTNATDPTGCSVVSKDISSKVNSLVEGLRSKVIDKINDSTGPDWSVSSNGLTYTKTSVHFNDDGTRETTTLTVTLDNPLNSNRKVQVAMARATFDGRAHGSITCEQTGVNSRGLPRTKTHGDIHGKDGEGNEAHLMFDIPDDGGDPTAKLNGKAIVGGIPLVGELKAGNGTRGRVGSRFKVFAFGQQVNVGVGAEYDKRKLHAVVSINVNGIFTIVIGSNGHVEAQGGITIEF
jgi:RHS repeat-associated protein